MKKVLFCIIVAMLAVCVGCGSSSSSNTSSGGKPTLQSIQVTPANPSVAAGQTQQFTATGVYSDSSNQNLTSTVNWSSSATAMATINSGGVANCKSTGSATVTATLQGVSGSTTLTVTPALKSITISPVDPSVVVGKTQQFSATGAYSDGSIKTLTTSVTWTSSSTNVATIAATTGLATTEIPGATTITATDSSTGIFGYTVLTVAPALVSISVTPVNPSIAPLTTEQFIATGTYSDHSTQNLTSVATWTSVSTTIATISNTPGTQGLATAVKQGTSIIQAAVGSIAGNTTLTVTNATLNSITVTPATPAIPLGTTQQFTATGNFSDGSTQNINATVTWSSSNTSELSITTGSGLATAKDLGTGISVTATWNPKPTISGSTTASVNAADLVSITISAAYSTIAENTSVQMVATGLFTDGGTSNITNLKETTWVSSNTPAATISANGVASGLAPGATMITATFGSINNTFTLNVTNATVSTITVTPENDTIAPGSVLQFTATGVFSDNSSQNISRNVAWSSDTPSVAMVSTTSGGGLATAESTGMANIMATLESVTGSAPLNVSGASLVSINLTPATTQAPAVLAPNSTLQFLAEGTYSDNSTQNLSTVVTWTSSNPAVVGVSSVGVATGNSAGQATITASQSGVTSNSADVVVESSAPSSIAITTQNLNTKSPQVPVGIISQFIATGTFTDGTQNLTSSVTWTSTPATIATISNASGSEGFATGKAAGSASISAVFDGVVATPATLTVTDATLVSISISPDGATIGTGTTQQFIATASFSDGTTVNVTDQAVWSSSNNSVASVSDGLATGVSSGSATINASLDGVSATGVALTVQ